jgi:hypothetical protein
VIGYRFQLSQSIAVNLVFFFFLLFESPFTFKDKMSQRSHKTVKNKGFSCFFLFDDGRIRIRTNNSGSGSTTLVGVPFFYLLVPIFAFLFRRDTNLMPSMPGFGALAAIVFAPR